jgi:excisionase family DNA binding protein
MGRTLNIKEAAQILGISDKTLRRRLKSGVAEFYIRHWKDGPRGDYKFDESDVWQWKEARKHHNRVMQFASASANWWVDSFSP